MVRCSPKHNRIVNLVWAPSVNMIWIARISSRAAPVRRTAFASAPHIMCNITLPAVYRVSITITGSLFKQFWYSNHLYRCELFKWPIAVDLLCQLENQSSSQSQSNTDTRKAKLPIPSEFIWYHMSFICKPTLSLVLYVSSASNALTADSRNPAS